MLPGKEIETPSACKRNLIFSKERKARKSPQKEQLSVNMVDTSPDWRIHLADNGAGMNRNTFTDIDEVKSTQGNSLKLASKVSFGNVDIDFPNDSKSSEDELRKLKARKMSNPFEATFTGSDVDYFVKERSVDSDCGVSSMESVMDSLKKLAKSLIPKQISNKEQTKGNQNTNAEKREERLKKVNPLTYFMPSSLLSCSRDYEGFRPEDEHKKAIKARIHAKVLRNVKQALQDSVGPVTESVCQLEVNLSFATRKLSALNPRKAAEKECILVHDSLLILRRSKPSACQAKPSIQRLADLSTGWYCYPLVTRGEAAWERVKPASDGMKKKCELFAPKAKNTATRATEIFEEEPKRAAFQEMNILLLAEDIIIEEGCSNEEHSLSCWDTQVHLVKKDIHDQCLYFRLKQQNLLDL